MISEHFGFGAPRVADHFRQQVCARHQLALHEVAVELGLHWYLVHLLLRCCSFVVRSQAVVQGGLEGTQLEALAN